MVVILNRIINLIFILTISLNASELNSKKLLDIFKKDYTDTLRIALDKTEFCTIESTNNSVYKFMFKNIDAKGKKLQYALFYLSVKNNQICEKDTLENLVIATSDYLYALKRYDEKNIDLYEKTERELKTYQFSVYTGKRLLYEASTKYKKMSASDKEKLSNIKELRKVFNFDTML